MKKIKVLFVCVHNSARSQMAEAFLNKIASDKFEVKSAGLEPGILNPLAVEVMREVGIDISKNKTKGVVDFFNSGEKFDYVITVCDETDAGKCPYFPGTIEVLHWSFEDPSGFKGTYKERLEKTRIVRDKIKARIEEWLKNFRR